MPFLIILLFILRFIDILQEYYADNIVYINDICVNKKSEGCDCNLLYSSHATIFIVFHYCFVHNILYLYTLSGRFAIVVTKVADNGGKPC